MRATDVIIIGGGQAGLAMSRCLVDRSIDHVVFERGRVAESWHSERWDSLRLLTPNWQTRLPGRPYEGDDPNGFMRASELAEALSRYGRSFSAPVEEQTLVRSVERDGDGYRVVTDRQRWFCRSVVIATGACGRPRVPEIAKNLRSGVHQLSTQKYKNPSSLPQAAVLVVGASASGVQIAEEIHRSGRPVTLAVGRHTRLPRQYRGRDIMWWLEALGFLSQSSEDVWDLEASRAQPSLQLIGRPDPEGLHLGKLQSMGVRLAGRLRSIDSAQLRFDDHLIDTMIRADQKLRELLDRIDRAIERRGWAPHVEPALRPDRIATGAGPARVDVRRERIESVIWATGYRSDYPWLRVPVLDRRGQIVHRGGVTPSSGLYVLGLRFLRRRKSNFIDGVGDDARVLAAHIAKDLRCANASAAA